MLRAKLIKNGFSGAGHISGVVVVACLIFLGWSRPALSGEPAAAPDEPSHLQLAPINLSRSFGGGMGYMFQRARYGATETTRQSLGVQVNAGVNIQSYFWQPWLAQVSSDLLVGVDRTGTNSSTNGHATPTSTAVGTSASGAVALNLVRYSRFPFEARVFRNDSRNDYNYSMINSDTQRTGYSLGQGYATQNNRLKGNASFTSSKSTGSNIVIPNSSDIFGFNLEMQPAQRALSHSIKISGNANSQKQPDQGLSSLVDTLVAHYAYQPNTIFSVGSVANLYKSNYSVRQGIISANSLQFSSFASLRPQKSALTMTSGVRFIRANSSVNGIPAPALKSSNFNLGANYLFSSLIRLYGSVNVADSLGTQTMTTDAAVTAGKVFGASNQEATDFGGFRYSRFVGGSLATSTSTTTHSTSQTATQSTQSINLGASLGHALNKDSQLGEGHLSTNLNQSVSTGVNLIDSSIAISNLKTGGSLSWQHTEGKATTVLRSSAADSRNLRGTHQLFQMINLQASRNETVSRNASLQGSLTLQATHQELGTHNTSNTVSPSAAMSYRHQRAFNVRNLTFGSSLQITNTNIAAGAQDQTARSWDNNLAYKIGALSMRLDTHIATADNISQSSILFMVDRQF